MTWAGLTPTAKAKEEVPALNASEKPLKYQKLAPLIVDRSVEEKRREREGGSSICNHNLVK